MREEHICRYCKRPLTKYRIEEGEDFCSVTCNKAYNFRFEQIRQRNLDAQNNEWFSDTCFVCGRSTNPGALFCSALCEDITVPRLAKNENDGFVLLDGDPVPQDAVIAYEEYQLSKQANQHALAMFRQRHRAQLVRMALARQIPRKPDLAVDAREDKGEAYKELSDRIANDISYAFMAACFLSIAGLFIVLIIHLGR